VSTDKRPLVLVVDDSEDMLALAQKALASDYEVITAADPGTAIEKASGQPRPDLILLDVEMPEIDGFEGCRALKGEAATSGIPIIFLTGKTEAQAQVEALELGAADYINKSSSNAAILRARVPAYLAKQCIHQFLRRPLRRPMRTESACVRSGRRSSGPASPRRRCR